MNTEKTFTLSRQACIALAIAAAFPVTSLAAAGRVEFAIGGATAISAGGASRQLIKGTEVNSGDTIKTTDGRVQVRFTDGGYMSFQPNTEFKIENYSYDGKQDGTEKGFFRLVEGGLRAITGIVGRNNRPAYRVATPVATIGIRGSEFNTEFSDDKLKTRVNGGSIYIENEFGNLILFKGQSSETEQGQKPKYSEEESGVQAKGPEGGEPDKGDQESKDEKEIQTVFVVNEQYGEEGQSCAISNTCEGQNIIAQYAAASAVGTYTGSTTSISGLNGNTTGTVTGDLIAYFGLYEVENTLTVSLVNNSASNSGTSEFSGLGKIGSNGNIYDLTLTAPSGGICANPAGCTASGIGAFTGPLAESASIGYVINGVNGSYTTGGDISTTVPYTGTIGSEDDIITGGT